MQFAFSVFFEIKFSILSNFDFAHRGERVIAHKGRKRYQTYHMYIYYRKEALPTHADKLPSLI